MGKRLYLTGLKALAEWFERQKRVLPWREDPSLYRVWVSEIMLQQTQVVTVIPYFERFVARFPSVEKLARASTDEVMVHWAGLGYYSRARNLHRAARQFVEAGGGSTAVFPRDRAGWEAVPGVGPYTAGAILSIALGQVEAILDGNVERVLSRLRRVARGRGDAIYKARLWRLAGAFVKNGAQHGIAPSVTNQALMEIGATVCTPRKPKCGECPLSALCRGRAENDAEAYPPRKAPKQWLAVTEIVHLILQGRAGKEKFLVARRATGRWRSGLWDLPEFLPFEKSALVQVGEIESRHVVTRHKIRRTTLIWRTRKSAAIWSAADPGGESMKWVPLGDPAQAQVAIGSALTKTLRSLALRGFVVP